MEENEFKLEHSNFYIVARSVIRNWWVILLAAAGMALLLSACEKLLYKPQYTSTATFAISAKGSGNAYTSLTMTKEMTQVFAEVFQSDILRERVAAEMGLKRLEGRVTTMVIPETNLLRIMVSAGSPEEAFRTLDIILKNYRKVSDYLFDNAILEIIKEPDVPMYPSNLFMSGKFKKLIVIFGGFGAFVGIVLLTMLRGTVQTVAGARDKLDGELLGIIPYEEKNKTKSKVKKKKTSVLLTNPLTSFVFLEAYQSLCVKLDYRMRKKGQKVILISSVGENEGKSTVASNLALAFAERGNKTLLIDCDFKKPSLKKIFEIPDAEGEDFSEMLEAEGDGMKDYGATHCKETLWIAANKKGGTNAQRLIHSAAMSEYVKRMRSEMDYIIIDSPPMIITADAEALMKLTDCAILVVRQDFALASDVNDSIDHLNLYGERFMGYVLNIYRDSFRKSKRVTETSHHS